MGIAFPSALTRSDTGWTASGSRSNYLAEAGASPAIAIYSNNSSRPGTKVCDIAVPTKIVESALTWGGNPPPYEFLAPDCANNTLVASTQYWIVFSNLNRRL